MKFNVWLIVILFSIVITLTIFAKPIKKAITRGYINNNPGNIRINSEEWQGEVVPSKDKSFKTFKSMAYGYRAIFVLLRSYINKHGLNTIRKIISTYAPANENKTDAYITFVSNRSGIDQDEKLSLTDINKLKSIVAAISYMENGVAPDLKEIDNGYLIFTKT